MDEFIKLLDKNLEYVSHEIISYTIYIYVVSNRYEYNCSHCGHYSNKVHSKYKRTFQYLPVQNKKVEIILNNKNIFAIINIVLEQLSQKTFLAFNLKERKIRLEEEISKIAINMSSIAAEKYLRGNIPNVSKSTICTLKRRGIKVI